MIHNLKIEENYLKRLLSGEKKAEVRINDRDYQKGDLLRFKEFRFDKEFKSDKEYLFEITHIHYGLGMKGNFVVLSIKHVETDEQQKAQY